MPSGRILHVEKIAKDVNQKWARSYGRNGPLRIFYLDVSTPSRLLRVANTDPHQVFDGFLDVYRVLKSASNLFSPHMLVYIVTYLVVEPRIFHCQVKI